MKFRFFLNITVLFLLLVSAQLQSQTLLKEDFNYPVLDSLEGTGGWMRTGLNLPYNVAVRSAGLTYNGYSGSGIGNTAFLSNIAEGDIVYKRFEIQTSGSVYMSYMFRVDSLTSSATEGTGIGFNPYNQTHHNTMLYVKKLSPTTFNLGIRKSRNRTYSSNVYNTNTTYLIVVKYTFVPGGNNNDSAKMYVFSSGVPATEPAVPTAFTIDSVDMDSQIEVRLSNNYAQGGSMHGSSFKVDGIRVGNSWATSILTDVTSISAAVPDNFSLDQNYPNPFNPETNIKFSIPEKSFVKLEVFNASGKLVNELLNANMEPGTYSARLNGSNLSSGTYFSRLTYNSQKNSGSRVVRMILIK